eukprot:2515698-Rhodomonas_salina.3
MRIHRGADPPLCTLAGFSWSGLCCQTRVRAAWGPSVLRLRRNHSRLHTMVISLPTVPPSFARSIRTPRLTAGCDCCDRRMRDGKQGEKLGARHLQLRPCNRMTSQYPAGVRKPDDLALPMRRRRDGARNRDDGHAETWLPSRARQQKTGRRLLG